MIRQGVKTRQQGVEVNDLRHRSVARKLGGTRVVIVGSPGCQARHDTPVAPDDLLKHNRLGANYVRAQAGWPLRQGGDDIVLQVTDNAQASDGEALHRLASFLVHKGIAAGRLLSVLENCNPGDIKEVHAVYVGQGGYLPLRVRVFLDFLAEYVRLRP